MGQDCRVLWLFLRKELVWGRSEEPREENYSGVGAGYFPNLYVIVSKIGELRQSYWIWRKNSFEYRRFRYLTNKVGSGLLSMGQRIGDAFPSSDWSYSRSIVWVSPKCTWLRFRGRTKNINKWRDWDDSGVWRDRYTEVKREILWVSGGLFDFDSSQVYPEKRVNVITWCPMLDGNGEVGS